MRNDDAFEFDAFISFDEADGDWVREVLLPRLASAGRTVRTSDDFEPGAPRLEESADAVKRSRKTVIVATAAYQASAWGPFESTLVQTLDPAARKRRVVPVALGAHSLPFTIRPLVFVDLSKDSEAGWRRLLDALDPSRPARTNPAQGLSLALADAMPEVGWNRVGLVLGAIALACIFVLAFWGYVFVQDLPDLIRDAALVFAVAAVVVFAFGLLMLAREDRYLFQRLSQVLGRSWFAKTATVALVAVTAAVHWTVGQPKVDCIIGVTCPRFWVAPFDNLVDARRIIGQKLAAVASLNVDPKLEVYGVLDQELTDVLRRTVNRVLRGSYVASDGQLTVVLEEVDGRLLTPFGMAVDRVDSPADRHELYTAVTARLLADLGVRVDAAILDVIAAVPTADLGAWDLKRRGDEFLRAGELEAAATAFTQAIALDETYADAHAGLGTVLERQDSWEEAAAAYRRAIDALPGYALFEYQLGDLLRRSESPEDLDEAASALERVTALDPTILAARTALGEVYLEMDRTDDAREVLDEGLRLAPESAPLHNVRGLVEVKAGQPGEALAWFAGASELDATYAAAHLNHAEALTVLGRWDDAATVYERAAVANPDDPVFPYRLAVHYAEASPADAVAPLEEALRIAPDFVEARQVLAQVYVDLDELDAARRQVDEGLRIDPNYAPLYNTSGLIEQAAGDTSLALVAFERASELDPNFGEALENRASALDVLGRGEEAVIVQENANQIMVLPVDPLDRFVLDGPVLRPR